MESREENLSLNISSSDYEYHSPTQYRTAALPKLSIPSPFQSEESSTDFETGSGSETPLTPGTPLSPLGAEFSFLGVSSQTSDAGEFATPRPRKRRYSKRRALNLKKSLFGTTIESPPPRSSKRAKISRPTSDLFSTSNSHLFKRVGQKSLIASTEMAVLSFNDGSLAYAALLNELGVTVSHNTLQFLARRDNLRNLQRKRRIVETHKRRRRQMATQITAAESSRRRRDKGAVYQSDRFGSEGPLSDYDSDTECEVCNDRNCSLPSKRKKDNWLACHKCETWFHWSCAGIKSKKGIPKYYFCTNCQSD